MVAMPPLWQLRQRATPLRHTAERVGVMFRKCAQHFEIDEFGGEVRWSMLADDSRHCWFCGGPGDDHVSLTITSNLPPFSPGTPAERVAAWVTS